MTATDKLEAAILRVKLLRDDLELMPRTSDDEYESRIAWLNTLVHDLESVDDQDAWGAVRNEVLEVAISLIHAKRDAEESGVKALALILTMVIAGLKDVLEILRGNFAIMGLNIVDGDPRD